jgi:predicted ATPase
LQAALALYRGNFLDGLALPDAPDFEDWLLLQRETWHNWATKVFDRLSELQTEGGELEHALETTTRWVAHDPLNEAAHARLIELHYALGDRAAALRVYENYRALLERELNTEPAPGTIALAEGIRAQTPPARVQAPYEPRSTQTSLEVPLTGRITEHLALVTAYRATRRGHMHVVTLEGEPGIGKTRLAREFLRWARAKGADVLEGHAFETGGRLPYQPLIEALRHRLEREKHLQKLLSNTWLAELTRLLPELSERYPTLPTLLTLDESEARTRLFEAVSRLGQSLAERSPIILFIDDAQWADASSLDVLHYAGRRWTSANVPVLLVMAFRSEDLASSVALANWLGGLERTMPLKRLLLAPLTFEDTLRLIESLSRKEGNGTRKSGELPGTPADGRAGLEAFSQQLFTETGGHPYFLIETLKSLAEYGILQADEAGEWTIDFDAAAQHYSTQRDLLLGGVRELIHTRLTHLSPNALAACMAGAVLGQGFDFEQLCHVGDLSESQGLLALDELLVRGLLRESGGRCSFVHDRVREVAYSEAGEVRRRIFHRRALEVLEVANAPAAEMARHARGAGMLERAFTLSLEAGDEAMRLFAIRDAIGHYAWARYLVVQSLPTHLDTLSLRRDLHQLYAQLGRVFELNSEREKARATYETMLVLSRKYSIPEMECASLNALATLIVQDLRNPEQARALLRQAMAVAETSRDTLGLVQTEWNVAQLALYSLDREMALSHSERALYALLGNQRWRSIA